MLKVLLNQKWKGFKESLTYVFNDENTVNIRVKICPKDTVFPKKDIKLSEKKLYGKMKVDGIMLYQNGQ